MAFVTSMAQNVFNTDFGIVQWKKRNKTKYSWVKMIPVWIIEELEKEKHKVEERPRLYIPIEEIPRQKDKDVVKSNRGVVKINIFGEDDGEDS